MNNNTAMSFEDTEETICCIIVEDEIENVTPGTSDNRPKIPKKLKKNKSNIKRSKLKKCGKRKKSSNKANTIVKRISPKPNSDTSSLYCDLLSDKLRALQESSRDIAMMKIDRIMYHVKRHDNRTRSFQYQNTVPSMGQPVPSASGNFHSLNLQPSTQHEVSPPAYSPPFNIQVTPQGQVPMPPPSYFNSFLPQASPQLQVSAPPPPVYSNSSKSQPPPRDQVSVPSAGNSRARNSEQSQGDEDLPPFSSYTQLMHLLESPEDEFSLDPQQQAFFDMLVEAMNFAEMEFFKKFLRN